MALMQPYVPEQKDYLERVLKGLQIAQAGMGIKTAYEQGKLNEVKLKQEKLDYEKKNMEARGVAENFWTNDAFINSIKAKPTTPNAIMRYLIPTLMDENGKEVVNENGETLPDLEHKKPEWRIPKESLQAQVLATEGGIKEEESKALKHKNAIVEGVLKNTFPMDYLIEQTWAMQDTPDPGKKMVYTWVSNPKNPKGPEIRVPKWVNFKTDALIELDYAKKELEQDKQNQKLLEWQTKTENPEAAAVSPEAAARQKRFETTTGIKLSDIRRNRLAKYRNDLTKLTGDIVKKANEVYQAKVIMDRGINDPTFRNASKDLVATLTASAAQPGVMTKNDYEYANMSAKDWLTNIQDTLIQKLGTPGTTTHFNNLRKLNMALDHAQRRRWNESVEKIWQTIESENDEVSKLKRTDWNPPSPFVGDDSYNNNLFEKLPTPSAKKGGLLPDTTEADIKGTMELMGKTVKAGGNPKRFFSPKEIEESIRNRPPEEPDLPTTDTDAALKAAAEGGWKSTLEEIKAGLSRFGSKKKPGGK